jgi:hypothetical protein
MNEDNFYNSTDAEGFTSCTYERAKRIANRKPITANRVTLLPPSDGPGADVVRIRQDKLL